MRRINSKKRGIVVHQTLWFVLALVLIGLVLLFIFKADILRYFQFLPQFETEDKEFDVEGDGTVDGPGSCPFLIGKMEDGRHIEECLEKEKGLSCNNFDERTDISWFPSEGVIKVQSGFLGQDDVIGMIENGKGMIYGGVVEETSHWVQKLDGKKIGSKELRANLDGAYSVSAGGNFICRDELVEFGETGDVLGYSDIMALRYIHIRKDVFNFRWNFGENKGEVLIEPNGNRFEFDGKDWFGDIDDPKIIGELLDGLEQSEVNDIKRVLSAENKKDFATELANFDENYKYIGFIDKDFRKKSEEGKISQVARKLFGAGVFNIWEIENDQLYGGLTGEEIKIDEGYNLRDSDFGLSLYLDGGEVDSIKLRPAQIEGYPQDAQTKYEVFVDTYISGQYYVERNVGITNPDSGKILIDQNILNANEGEDLSIDLENQNIKVRARDIEHLKKLHLRALPELFNGGVLVENG